MSDSSSSVPSSSVPSSPLASSPLEEQIRALEAAWQRGHVVVMKSPQQRGQLQIRRGALAVLAEQWGPGVVVASGGSSGARRWCLQPLAHLQASAAATAEWLRDQGIDPAACLHLNPLPLHHVSGLLPLVRSRSWGAGHQILPPQLLRNPTAMLEAVPLPGDRPVVMALVPTQLARLMAEPQGRRWLQQLALVWVGGAALPESLAQAARDGGIRLAPCYGATETAAMVCALAPHQFLAGASGCGQPLADVRLRIDASSGAVEVATTRLSPGWVGEGGGLEALPLSADGCWRSGDGGRLGPQGLEIFGRLDGAIHSGGETVFPEQLEARLRGLALRQALPLQELLLLGVAEPEWGQRLVALVRPRPGADGPALLSALERSSKDWPGAERPRRWLLCGSLAPSTTGKWQRGHWQRWLQSLEADQPPGP